MQLALQLEMSEKMERGRQSRSDPDAVSNLLLYVIALDLTRLNSLYSNEHKWVIIHIGLRIHLDCVSARRLMPAPDCQMQQDYGEIERENSFCVVIACRGAQAGCG